MNTKLLIPISTGIVFILLFLLVSATLPVVLVFIPGVVLTFLFYLKFCNRQPPLPGTTLPLYLLALAIQFLHFSEEYIAGFTVEIPKLLGLAEPFPTTYWVVFNMVAYAVFILGGIVLLESKTEWMMIPLFFVVTGVLLNGVGHCLISIYVGGYFPGLFTALPYLIIGPLLIRRFITVTTNPNPKS